MNILRIFPDGEHEGDVTQWVKPLDVAGQMQKFSVFSVRFSVASTSAETLLA